MMSTQAPPFTPDQIGTFAVRFPSGQPVPDITDISVDPYWRTRMPKGVQVEALQFWPQVKGKYPGLVLLHEWWGLNVQIKDLAARLAREGYTVLVPNLYVRQGGMVTASAEVAEALMAHTNEADLLQDINSCCEFLNTQDAVSRNVHGVIGFGMGGTLALRFGCVRKRLKAAVSFYGRMLSQPDLLKDLYCPVLYHRAGADRDVSEEDMERLRQAAKERNKRLEILTYPDAPPGFCNETRTDTFRREAAESAWQATATFLRECFKDAK
jgi:carboxymethylenebutenolidase